MAKKPVRYTVSDGKLVLTLEVAEEGGYLVTSPLDPDVLTEAETLEEAFENARDVIELYRKVRAEERRAAGKKSGQPGKKPKARAGGSRRAG